jgi:hypothetical protein
MSDPVFRYRRVSAYEGKHGVGDFRLEINGTAPTHGELLVLLAGILKAERRYETVRSNQGAYLLWEYISTHEPLFAKSWADIEKLASDADSKKKNRVRSGPALPA